MALVTPEDLARYMSGIRMNDEQKQSAEDILAGVQSELEDHINRPLEPVRSRELVRVDRSGYVNVRHTPVHAVLRIQDYGSTLPSRPTDVVDNYAPEVSDALPLVDYAPVNNGQDMIVPGGVRYGTPGGYVLIEYLSGSTEFVRRALPKVKLAIMRVAAREFDAMHNDSVRVRGGSTESTPPPEKIGWTDEEKAAFDRLRRRVVA